MLYTLYNIYALLLACNKYNHFDENVKPCDLSLVYFPSLVVASKKNSAKLYKKKS